MNLIREVNHRAFGLSELLLSVLHGGFCIQAHSALESPQPVVKGPNSWKWLVIKVLSSRLHLQEAGKDISLHKFVAMGKVKNTLSYTRYLIPKARHSRKRREIKGIKQLGW